MKHPLRSGTEVKTVTSRFWPCDKPMLPRAVFARSGKLWNRAMDSWVFAHEMNLIVYLIDTVWVIRGSAMANTCISWVEVYTTRKLSYMLTSTYGRRARFGAYVVDFRSAELFKHGIRIKLQDQPFQILTILLESHGELVSREVLRKKLWAEDTYVDFDAGLNAAIRKLRDALCESAEAPRFIETLPRHGYRFIAQVEAVLEPERPKELTPPANPTMEISPPQSVSPFPVEEVRTRSAGMAANWTLAAFLFAAGILVVILTTTNWRSRFFSTRASTGIQSIAVLPLQDLSDDPSREYFADGMTDALITDLAQIKSLRVISRTSSMQFKGTKKRLPEIAKDLNVDALVEGTVVRSGSRVRINAQLIRADNEGHLWAQSYERSMSDVVGLQAEVATRIAAEIEANLTSQENAKLTKARAVNPEAYEDYLRGEYFYSKETNEGFEKAIDYYQKSIDLDPNFAPAYVGLAEDYGFMAYTRRTDPKEAWNKSEILLQKALELDPNSSLAHVLVGMTKLQYHCDRSGAEREIQRALELNPADMGAVDYHSYYLLEVGRTDEAIAEKKKVLEHDPVSVGTSAELGLYLLNAGRNEEAVQQLQKTLELDPNFPPALTRLGLAYEGQQKYEQAVMWIKKALVVEQVPGRLGRLGEVYARWGKKKEALEVIEELKKMGQQRYVPPNVIALIYARLGQNEEALSYIEKATREDSPSLSDSGFDNLRTNPRFKVLEARLVKHSHCAPY
jgi:TolB-like protein/DNA-binding winged helix-turn-helix (wHTH) protein/Flp pilus assembly protein TadD